jgi:RNase P subunit RPR2
MQAIFTSDVFLMKDTTCGKCHSLLAAGKKRYPVGNRDINSVAETVRWCCRACAVHYWNKGIKDGSIGL